MRVIENNLTPNIFTSLRKTGPFKPYQDSDIEVAIKNSLYTVYVVDDNDEPIGMARIVGDGRIAFFIKDVVVTPQHQGKYVGTLIMEHLLAYIEAHCCDNAYVGLMSTPHKEGFYEKFGFQRRPNVEYGAGMVMYIRKGESK